MGSNVDFSLYILHGNREYLVFRDLLDDSVFRDLHVVTAYVSNKSFEVELFPALVPRSGKSRLNLALSTIAKENSMVSSGKLSAKYIMYALIEFAVLMGFLLVVSILTKNGFWIENTPLVAGMVAVVFCGSLHSAVKVAYESGLAENSPQANT